MLRFISFGSGSSGNCYFLQTANEALLIDTGVGLRTLKKYAHDFGINLQNVKHILITHDHADHIKCVGSISGEMHLPVYATEIVHNGIDRNYCVARKISSDLRRFIVPGETYVLGDFCVKPFTVPHDSSDNVGYELIIQGISFCVMTDVGHVTEEMSQYINRAHYLVIEANYDCEMLSNGPYPQYLKNRITSGTGHLSNIQCGEAIVTNMSERLRHVWLCHLSQENNHPELARKTVETVARSRGIIVNKDFCLDVLKRSMPTGVFDLAID